MSRKNEIRGTLFGTGLGALIGAETGKHVGIALLGTAIPGTGPLIVVAATTAGLIGNKIGSELDKK